MSERISVRPECRAGLKGHASVLGAIIGARDGTRRSESARILADRGTLAVDGLQLSKNERLVEDRRERRPGPLNHVAQSTLAEQLSDLVAQQADPFRVRIEVETAVREVAAHTFVVIEQKTAPRASRAVSKTTAASRESSSPVMAHASRLRPSSPPISNTRGQCAGRRLCDGNSECQTLPPCVSMAPRAYLLATSHTPSHGAPAGRSSRALTRAVSNANADSRSASRPSSVEIFSFRSRLRSLVFFRKSRTCLSAGGRTQTDDLLITKREQGESPRRWRTRAGHLPNESVYPRPPTFARVHR